MGLRDVFLENRIKGLLKKFDYKSKKGLKEIFFRQPRFDENMLGYYFQYVEKKGEFSVFEYEELMPKGVTQEDIIKNDNVADLLAQDIAKRIENNLLNKNLLDLLNVPKINSKVRTLINIQELGMNLIREDKTHLLRNALDIYNTLGFKVDFDFEKDKNILFNTRFQRELMELNLISPEVVSQMYHYKYETYKEMVKNSSANYEYEQFSTLPILPSLIPLPDDEMANYWREMAEKLEFDVLKHIMENMSIGPERNVFSEDGFENSSPKSILFTKDGLPTINLFNDPYYSRAANKIMYAFWERDGNVSNLEYDYKMILYFLENIEKIENPVLKGIVKTWGKLLPPDSLISYYGDLDFLSSEVKENLSKFMQFATGGHRIHENLFDENGITEEFYQRILFCPQYNTILPLIDENWESHYTPQQIKMIEILSKFPELMKIFYSIPGYSGDYVKFFDESGLNEKFYKGILEANLIHQEILSRTGPDWEKHYTKKELNYIKIAKQNDEIYSFFRKTKHDLLSAIEAYVLEEDYRLNSDFFNVCYSEGKWDFIFEFCHESDWAIFDEFKLASLNECNKITSGNLKNIFISFVLSNLGNISIDKLGIISTLLTRIEYSNSSEILHFSDALASQLIVLDDPLAALNQIEDIFLRNNLPVIGKVYSTFEILHPNTSGFNYNSTEMSPVLKKVQPRERGAIIFADLLKASLGSNNRSLREYFETIEVGNQIFQKINSGEIGFEHLESEHLQILSTYLEHLNTLYNNTLAGKIQSEPNILTGNIEADMQNLVKLFSENGELDYNMPDRIVKMFGFYAGITTFDQAKKYFLERPIMADKRNRRKSNQGFCLEVGDFVKGINDIRYLENILQNGSVAKEFLGDAATSDGTPLDTDLSRILEVGSTIEETMKKTLANKYGNIWLVLKNDGRFYETRVDDGIELDEIDHRKHRDQLEAFMTASQGHYGIRTGFASTEIDYIMCEKYDKRIGIEIAKNGFYIPVVDKNGELVFSPKDYDKIRMQMGGLTYYGAGPFQYSDALVSEEIYELADQVHDNVINTNMKRQAINQVIAAAINKIGLKLKTSMDGDLTEGSVELIDTGSTARGTNMIGDGDFDFLMRVDKSILTNPEKMQKLTDAIKEALSNASKTDITAHGDFRYKKVNIPGLEVPVDIDITFTQKTNKTNYSTEMALNERLTSILKDSEEKYALVAANIITAKKVLKAAGCYKPNRGEVPQGGLGGVGIENWILVNGGSFEQAARSFLEAAEGKTFEEFRTSYGVYDFGQNHMARGAMPYDNFVTRNMSAEGFEKMKAALKEYLLKLNPEYDDSEYGGIKI